MKGTLSSLIDRRHFQFDLARALEFLAGRSGFPCNGYSMSLVACHRSLKEMSEQGIFLNQQGPTYQLVLQAPGVIRSLAFQRFLTETAGN